MTCSCSGAVTQGGLLLGLVQARCGPAALPPLSHRPGALLLALAPSCRTPCSWAWCRRSVTQEPGRLAHLMHNHPMLQERSSQIARCVFFLAAKDAALALQRPHSCPAEEAHVW